MEIKFHLTLKELSNKEEVILHLTKRKKLNLVLEELNIPLNEVGMVVRNGKWDTIDCIVDDADFIEVFPILSGG